jgi:signal transduction histidine kinase
LWTAVLIATGFGALGLLAGAVRDLWQANSAGIERERARASAPVRLVEAGRRLAAVGGPILALIPDWPETLDPIQWDRLNEWLADRASEALGTRPGTTGGYFVPQEDRFLGRKPGAAVTLPIATELVDPQVREAWRRDEPVWLIVEQSGQSIGLRAEPIRINDRRLAVVWSVVRIDDAFNRSRILSLYDRSSRRALGGMALAALMAVVLAARVRQQAFEQRAMQAELRRTERLAALGKLLAGVAHEVRNPLAGLRSTVQLWQRGLAPDHDTATDILAEVDRLEGLVTRLLQFSRAESGRRRQVDLNELMRELARGIQPVTAPLAIELNLELDPRCPPVLADADGILQAVRNLALNAIQEMPEGGQLTLTTARRDGGRTAEVRVTDTGPGLDDEVRSHLFEPFFTTRVEGTGLGLAIAREIALAHGGELVDAPNRPGVAGAEFVLTLPTR